MGCMTGCIYHAHKIYSDIEPTLNAAGYTVSMLRRDSYSFCVFWPGSSVGVSISCPPYVNRQSGRMSRDDYVDEIELVLTNGVPVYESNAGYDHVCRFDVCLELLTEVRRLRAYFTANPMVITDATPHAPM